MAENFEKMLSGGKPNSLGRTDDAVKVVEQHPDEMQALFDTYKSDDDLVRLRVSSAFKRLAKSMPAETATFIPQFITLSATLDQPSFQWSFAEITTWLNDRLDQPTRKKITKILQHNLETSHDWIVLNTTMDALMERAKDDPALQKWLRPQLKRLTDDSRKSVHARAVKYYAALKSAA